MAVNVGLQSAPTKSNEERRETGLSLMVIGAMLWCFDALVFFFLPAGMKLGQQKGFFLLTGSALLLGAAIVGVGMYLRKSK
jgi:hypothetical protein